ncbi:MAG: hypothetical protein ABEI74_02960 [Candidatus Pacearchaeota archaeon]
MEQKRLDRIESEISMLRKAVENIQARLFDEESGKEVNQEVDKEVEEARKSENVSNDEVVQEFLK